MLGKFSLGNLNDKKSSECFSAEIPKTKAVSIGLECKSGDNGKGFKMTNLRQFGLAYKSQTCTGLGAKMKVETIKKCSIGNMGE